jgi:hypothetical protein
MTGATLKLLSPANSLPQWTVQITSQPDKGPAPGALTATRTRARPAGPAAPAAAAGTTTSAAPSGGVRPSASASSP